MLMIIKLKECRLKRGFEREGLEGLKDRSRLRGVSRLSFEVKKVALE